MLFFLIAIVMVAIGAVFMCKDLPWNWDWVGEWLAPIIFILGLMLACVVTTLALAVQCPKQLKYEEAMAKKEALEYRLEHREENIVGNEMLYSEILEFNNSIRVDKKRAGSPWVGWFVNDKIAEIDYIDYMEE